MKSSSNSQMIRPAEVGTMIAIYQQLRKDM